MYMNVKYESFTHCSATMKVLDGFSVVFNDHLSQSGHGHPGYINHPPDKATNGGMGNHPHYECAYSAYELRHTPSTATHFEVQAVRGALGTTVIFKNLRCTSISALVRYLVNIFAGFFNPSTFSNFFLQLICFTGFHQASKCKRQSSTDLYILQLSMSENKLVNRGMLRIQLSNQLNA